MDSNSRQNYDLPAKSRCSTLARSSPCSISTRKKFRVCFEIVFSKHNAILLNVCLRLIIILFLFSFIQVQKSRRKRTTTWSYEFIIAHDLPIDIATSTWSIGAIRFFTETNTQNFLRLNAGKIAEIIDESSKVKIYFFNMSTLFIFSTPFLLTWYQEKYFRNGWT